MINKINKMAAVAMALGLCLILSTGCALQSTSSAKGGVAGTLARLKPLADDCRGPINAYVGLDASATGRGDPTLIASRLEAIHDTADLAAACGGYMKVVAFSSGAAQTFPLGEAPFPTSSGTETARLIQANDAEDDLIGDVEDSLPAGLRQLNPNGTDVLAQLTLAHQFQRQRSEGRLYVRLATDGISTAEPVIMNTPAFTVKAATAAAERIAVPRLAGATVLIVGLGQTSGKQRPSTARIQALTVFYRLVCERTGADDCLATTDYTAGG